MQAERIPLATLLDGPLSDGAMAQVAARIREKAVFVYPTDTIYGIGGIVDTEVERRIIRAKKRPPENPMLLVAARAEAFAPLGLVFNDTAKALADAFWPGSLTLVLRCRATQTGVGVRLSSHPFITGLSGVFDTVLYSTSANISGQPYVNDPDVIYDTLRGNIDFMVDAGALPPCAPSTLAEVGDDGVVRIIRQGAVSKERIASVAGRRMVLQ